MNGAAPRAAFNPAQPRVPAGGATGGQFGPGGGGATPTNAKPVGKGATGQSVRDLQRRLNAEGAKPPLTVDGIFGDKTLAAVRTFQGSHKDAQGKPLKVDGLVGPLTTGALRTKTGTTSKTSGKKTTPRKTPARKAKPATTKHPAAKLSDKPGSATKTQKTRITTEIARRKVPAGDASDFRADFSILAESEAAALLQHITSHYPLKPKPATTKHAAGLAAGQWRSELHPRVRKGGPGAGRFAGLDTTQSGRHPGPGSFAHIRTIEQLARQVDTYARATGTRGGQSETAVALRNAAFQIGMRQIGVAKVHMAAALSAARREKAGPDALRRIQAIADSLDHIPRGTYPEPGFGMRTGGPLAPPSLRHQHPSGPGYYPRRIRKAASPDAAAASRFDPAKHRRREHGSGGGQFTTGGGGGAPKFRPAGAGAGGGGWEQDYAPPRPGGWTPDLTPASGVKALTSHGRPKPPATGTADDPIDVAGNLDSALTLMHQGQHVRLNQVDEVALLLAKVDAIAKQSRPAGEKAPDWDFGLLTVTGTNLFTAQTKGITRIDMPQFSGLASPGTPAAKLAGGDGKFVDLTPQFADALKAQGISVTPRRVPAAHLRATQTELVGSKVAGFANAVRSGNPKAVAAINEPIYVTRDNYVIDGHHRWAANMMLDSLDGKLGNDTFQNVLVVDMDIGAAIPYSNAFATRMGIAGRGGVAKKTAAALSAGLGVALDALVAAESPAPHPGSAETLHRYWGTGPGAAKIRWGTDGDHMRCVDQLVEHGHMTEGQAHGYCNLMEKRVTGQYPAQHAQKDRAAHAANSTSGLPALVTMPAVDILAAGTWHLSTGRQTFTQADLRSAIDAAGCPAVGAPLIKIGHLDPRFAPLPEHDGEPALGRVHNLRLSDNGAKIIGDLAGMPGWLGAIAASAFPRRSVEGKYGFKCQIGHDHPFVLTGLALLGVTAPGVGVLGGLPDIATLYGLTAAAPAGQAWHTEQDQEGTVMAVTEEDVRREYYATAGAPQSWWITELQMTPPQLIVADEQSGRIYRIGYRIDGSAVSFDPPAEVASYADVAASRGTGTVVAFASAADSRAVTPPGTEPPGPAAAAGWQDEPADQIRWGLGWLAAAYGRGSPPGGNPPSGQEPGTSQEPGSFADRVGRVIDIRAQAGDDTDPALAAETRALIASLDTTLDLASELAASAASGFPDATQVLGLLGEAEVTAGELAAQLGITDIAAAASDDDGDESDTADGTGQSTGSHGMFDGEHDHAHPAFGQQGGDATHSHPHSHSGDGRHNHAHDTKAAATPAAATTEEGTSGMGYEFTTQQMAAIRARLGKQEGEEITPGDIAAVFGAPQPPWPVQAAAAGTSGTGAVEVPVIADGVHLVEANILRKYQEEALAGRRAVRAMHVAERDTILAAAIKEGKFAQSRLDHFQALWDRDPDGTRKLVASLAGGLVPMSPMGSNGDWATDPDMPGDFDGQRAYADLYPEDTKGGISAAPGVRGGAFSG